MQRAGWSIRAHLRLLVKQAFNLSTSFLLSLVLFQFLPVFRFFHLFCLSRPVPLYSTLYHVLHQVRQSVTYMGFLAAASTCFRFLLCSFITERIGFHWQRKSLDSTKSLASGHRAITRSFRSFIQTVFRLLEVSPMSTHCGIRKTFRAE
jgi:hypothetical protein